MSASPTPHEPAKQQNIEENVRQEQKRSPWPILSVNGLLVVIVLIGLALLFYYTLWPR